jgi:hypothetical protein
MPRIDAGVAVDPVLAASFGGNYGPLSAGVATTKIQFFRINYLRTC